MEANQVYIDHTMLASGSKRFANYIADTVAFYLVFFIIGIVAGFLSLLGSDGMLLWFSEINYITELIFNLSIIAIYFIFMEGLTQRTLGKFITGTKVVMEDGSKPPAGVIVKRTLCRFIPFEQFSFLGSSPVGWHDSISKTYVIDIKKFEEEVYRRTSLMEIGQQQEE